MLAKAPERTAKARKCFAKVRVTLQSKKPFAGLAEAIPPILRKIRNAELCCFVRSGIMGEESAVRRCVSLLRRGKRDFSPVCLFLEKPVSEIAATAPAKAADAQPAFRAQTCQENDKIDCEASREHLRAKRAVWPERIPRFAEKNEAAGVPRRLPGCIFSSEKAKIVNIFQKNC